MKKPESGNLKRVEELKQAAHKMLWQHEGEAQEGFQVSFSCGGSVHNSKAVSEREKPSSIWENFEFANPRIHKSFTNRENLSFPENDA